MKKISRNKWISGIAIAVMILLTTVVPPNRSHINAGSTYDRSPSGYAGWYAYAGKQGVKVQRWQKPFESLNQKFKKPITLIRIKPEWESIDFAEDEWVKKGNNLIILGVSADVTAAPFSSAISNKQGTIKIETKRRHSLNQPLLDEKLASAYLNSASNQDAKLKKSVPKYQKLLSDEFGSIVWQIQNEDSKKGTVIASATPYLAANAYQDEMGNYKFLTNLAIASNTPIYVDEFIHGYKDADVEKPEAEKNWIRYLMATPLFAGAAQALVVLTVFIIAKNLRFGAPIAADTASVNNSQVYIEALSSVLQKAQRNEFVWQAIAKAEKKKLQQKLGIGKQEDREAMVRAWIQQTGRSREELEHLLNPPQPKIKDQELLTWLQAWQNALAAL